jgi:hypothetical protein
VVGIAFQSRLILLQENDDHESDDLQDDQWRAHSREVDGAYDHGNMSARTDVSSTREGGEGADIS